jgi:hypothetical protein
MAVVGSAAQAQRQPQQGATDGDKQKNSQDAVTEKQIPAFLASRYPKHANYKRGKAKMVARRLAPKKKSRGAGRHLGFI